eukprot:3691388-Prymnesium_polylepis.1
MARTATAVRVGSCRSRSGGRFAGSVARRLALRMVGTRAEEEAKRARRGGGVASFVRSRPRTISRAH